MRNQLLLRAVAVLLLFSTAACYRMIPLQSTQPAPDTRVVATLTDEGTVAMSELIGSGATAVEGVVIGADSAQWSMRMLRVDHRDGRSIDWNREVIAFPRATLTNAMERRTDTRKSWLAAGLIVGGALLLAATFDLVGGDVFKSTDPVPQQILIPGDGR